MADQLYDEAQARPRLGNMSRSQLFKQTQLGEIQSVKIGRRRYWPQSAIDEYIQKLKEQAKAS